MKFGVCGSPEIAPVAAAAGFDYLEWSVQAFLQPRDSAAAFETALEAMRASPLPIPACNIFIPGDLPVSGPEVDLDALHSYVATACERAARAGVDTIVFGSGKARAVPAGFDHTTAEAQLLRFLQLAAPLAAAHGVTIVIEPLRHAECNILNTVAESARMVRAVNHPAIQLLVDGYHWAWNGESESDILAAAPLFKHMHLATVDNRRPPGSEPCEALPRFLQTVAACGYQGRISFEGRLTDPATELPQALRKMREGLQE